MNGDGFTDLVVACRDACQSVIYDLIVGFVEAPGAIFFNDGSGRKYERRSFGDNKGTIYGLAAADLDGDGYLDIAAARSDAPSLVFFSRQLRAK
jgi:hypothetical protein